MIPNIIQQSDRDALLARLERMIAEPAWLIFYMQKAEAELCVEALRTNHRANEGGGDDIAP